MKEFLDCPNEKCKSRVRWDEYDKQYSCGACNTTLSVTLAPAQVGDECYYCNIVSVAVVVCAHGIMGCETEPRAVCTECRKLHEF